ncbi:MAG: ATP-dependent helicase [Acidobacteriota bacterium]
MDRCEALLRHLDEDQTAAVTHGEGPLLVVAGAGSGKTRVLTHRIAWLLARGVAASHEVIAVTFTNKAAREMADRVSALVGGTLAGGFVGTFHRFALQLLRAHAREAGLPGRFAIADEDDQRRILEGALKRLGVTSTQLPVRTVRSRISAAKNAMISPREAAEAARTTDAGLIADVYAAYETDLRAAAAVDFDDMLLLSIRLLEREEGLRRGLANRFRWQLVDEFQDTNAAQARLLALLGGSRPNLTVVGDEDQSIYRWRGAEVENILRFDRTYPGATVVVLGNNYRSSEPILRAAAGVIANNAGRREKRLVSRAGPGDPVVVFLAADELDEARVVADLIDRLRGEVELGAIAVLFRINALSRPFEAELVRRGVPYVVVGGTRFWERAEVKDALAYLRLVVAPDDSLAFRRAIRVPARGVGEATMDVLERDASADGESLPAVARRRADGLTPRATRALEEFFRLIDELSEMAEKTPPGEVVESLLVRSGLAAQYGSEDEEDRGRRANLEELVSAAAEAAERGVSLKGFMDEVALLTDADVRASGQAVQLSTLHAAKGLEFDAVFLVGLEDGLLPLRRGDDPGDVEEERRLAYVGMTRARRRLCLSWARARRLHGQLMPGRPSPFLLEVPRDTVRDLTPALGRDPFRAQAPAPQPPFARRRGDDQPAGTLAPARPARTPAHPDGWRPGLKVRHPSYGVGVILQVQGSAAQTRLVVYFDRAGRKTLIPSLAKLEKL